MHGAVTAPGDESRFPTSLGGQFRRHLPQYLLGTAMLAVFQIAMNRIDDRSGKAIDQVFGTDPGAAWVPAATMLALAVVAFVTRVASRWWLFNAGRDAEYELRFELLAKLHKLGAAFYRKMSAGEIMARSTSDLQQVRMLFGFGALNIVNVVFAFVSALQIMVGVSWPLTLACLANLPLVTIFSRWASRGLYTRMRDNQAAVGRMSDVLQANLAGVRVVRSFALEERERDRFEASNRDYLRASLSLARLRGSFQPIIGAVAALGVLVFFWYGSSLLLDGGLSRGSFFKFWSAFARMTWPMIAIGFALSIVQRGRAGYARLRDVFDAKPEVVDGPLPAPAHVDGTLSVRHLGFAYGKRKVVDDVSFEVPQGRSLAIMGRTGSGKTTLAMLLARLLPTPAGTVFIDGTDVCELPLAAVRSVIGYAQQDAFLFSTTVERNVGFALSDPDSPQTQARVRDAAREAQVLEEALSLPDGFDTVVGERGVQLSGGQRQRIAIARAFLKDAPVLVLDEATSHVDAKTEAAILEAFERQAAQRTVLLVTHRVAAASRCDRVVVLEEGRIVEQGSHDELVALGGIYAAFAEEQAMARELEEIDEPPVEARGEAGVPS
jgi:ATP-binding cassette subfamily B multidrug efflux pump